MPRITGWRWVASVLAPAVAFVAACTGGSDLLGGDIFTGSSGAGGAVGGTSGASAPHPPGSAGREDDAVFPVVACTPPPSDDADADVPDADAPDAAADAAADGTSPCETPPPGQCAGRTTMIELLPGACTEDGTCAFSRHHRACPGGCFRQLDGGHRCNE